MRQTWSVWERAEDHVFQCAGQGARWQHGWSGGAGDTWASQKPASRSGTLRRIAISCLSFGEVQVRLLNLEPSCAPLGGERSQLRCGCVQAVERLSAAAAACGRTCDAAVVIQDECRRTPIALASCCSCSCLCLRAPILAVSTAALLILAAPRPSIASSVASCSFSIRPRAADWALGHSIIKPEARVASGRCSGRVLRRYA